MEHKADKGVKGGSCNRESCQMPGAFWFNHSTLKYYCEECAHWLNSDTFNQRDALKIWGHALCTLEYPATRYCDHLINLVVDNVHNIFYAEIYHNGTCLTGEKQFKALTADGSMGKAKAWVDASEFEVLHEAG